MSEKTRSPAESLEEKLAEKREESLAEKLEESLEASLDDDILVCRCEEITLGEVRRAIAEGAYDVTGVKRRTRAGMGLCQGRSCQRLVQQILRQELKSTPEEIGAATPRPPVKPITFGSLAGGGLHEKL